MSSRYQKVVLKCLLAVDRKCSAFSRSLSKGPRVRMGDRVLEKAAFTAAGVLHISATACTAHNGCELAQATAIMYPKFRT